MVSFLEFRQHPVACQVVDVFGFHDRKKFEVYAYAYGRPDTGYPRSKIEAGCDKFRDMASQGYLEIADQINQDQVDILIDLTPDFFKTVVT